MRIAIDIDVDKDKLYIRETACIPEEYIISEDYPTCIDEICEYLHDYLEGLE